MRQVCKPGATKAARIGVALLLVQSLAGCSYSENPAAPGAAVSEQRSVGFMVPPPDAKPPAEGSKQSPGVAWYAHCSGHSSVQCGQFDTLADVQRAVKLHNDYYHDGNPTAYYDHSRCW